MEELTLDWEDGLTGCSHGRGKRTSEIYGDILRRVKVVKIHRVGNCSVMSIPKGSSRGHWSRRCTRDARTASHPSRGVGGPVSAGLGPKAKPPLAFGSQSNHPEGWQDASTRG
jgi:hypothetical protein